jgi:hypothetical protein
MNLTCALTCALCNLQAVNAYPNAKVKYIVDIAASKYVDAMQA